MSRAQLSETLETAGLTCDHHNCPLPLCTHHYHMVYKLLKPTASNNCSLCGMSLKNTMAKRCPNPRVIEHHLHDHSEFDGHIDESDKICYTCYRAHLVILQHYDTVSLDTDLENLLDMLSKQTTTISTEQEAIDHSMREVVVFVGRQLLKHRAMLLPTIYNMLCQTARDTLQLHNLDSTIKVTSIVSTRWVLSSITAALEGHVQYHCTVRKYGTLIYRRSSDLRTALSHALWTSHHRTPPVENKFEVNSPLQQEREVLEALNDRVQAQIKAFNDKDLDLEHSNFNIERVIGELDPILWEAINVLTQSVSERRGTSAVLKEGSAERHIKRVRRLFLLCSLLFTVNDHCSSPMHVLVADILESQGTTTLLHQILNRLGVCASADTLARFVQSKAEKSNWLTTTGGNIDREPFTVVSADNIDFVHKYARIVGKGKTSWHGTTVQAVQPQPSLSIILPDTSAALLSRLDSDASAALLSRLDSDASADLLSRSHGANALLSRLDPDTSAALLSRLDSDASADLLSRSHGANALLSRLDPDTSAALLSRLDSDASADLLTRSHGASALLSRLDPDTSAVLLSRLDSDASADLLTRSYRANALLSRLDPDTSAALLSRLDSDASADLLTRSHGANALLSRLDPDTSAALLSRLDSDASADLLTRSHGANALLSRLDPDTSAALLSRLDSDASADLLTRSHGANALLSRLDSDASADLLTRSHGANALLSRLDSDASADLLTRSHGANALLSRLDPDTNTNQPGWNEPRDFTIMLRDHGYMTRDINDETRRLSAVYR